jgi:hypothetical protein
MTTTTTTITGPNRTQALTWVARQLRWERTLAALRAGRTQHPATTERKAA